MKKYFRLSTAQDVIEVLRYSTGDEKCRPVEVNESDKCYMICEKDITKDLPWDIGRIISVTLTRPNKEETQKFMNDILFLLRKGAMEEGYRKTCEYWFCLWKRHVEEEMKKEKRAII